MASYAQSNRKKGCMKLIFLHAGEHQMFLQVETILFAGFHQSCPKYIHKFALSLQYLKKEVRNEVYFFYMQVNIKVFHKLILSFLTDTASMSKVPKISSFQYLRNVNQDYFDFCYVHRPPTHTQSKIHFNPISVSVHKF